MYGCIRGEGCRPTVEEKETTNAQRRQGVRFQFSTRLSKQLLPKSYKANLVLGVGPTKRALKARMYQKQKELGVSREDLNKTYVIENKILI